MADARHELSQRLLPEETHRLSGHTRAQRATASSNSTEHQRGHVLTPHQGVTPSSESESSSVFKIAGWPNEPLPSARTRTATFLSIVLDVLLLTFALLFLALAIGALVVDGRAAGDRSGNLIERAEKLGPTVFPIIFAALVGRALKAIGRFRSEKGIKMSTLWAFVSTKTVFDAFLLQWSLGALSLPTILMGLLWAMSPAGGQASLRILFQTDVTSTTPTNLRYMDTGPLGLVFTWETLLVGYDMAPGQSEDFPFSMTSSLVSALMQTVETKSGPRDSWGNPKIPRLDILDQSTADEDGWIEVSTSPTVESYTSLFGLPILGVPEEGIVEFGVEYAYVELGAVLVEQVQLFDNYTKSLLIESTCSPRSGYRCPVSANPDDSRLGQLLGPPWVQPNSSQLSQQAITNATVIKFKQPRTGVTVSSTVTQKLVEAQIVCENGLCRATKSRPSTTDHRPENMTVFDFWGELALDMLEQANGERRGTPTLLELFVNDTSTIPVNRANAYRGVPEESLPDLAAVDPGALSERITLLLNSAMNLLYSYYGFAGTLPAVESVDYGPPHTPADGLSAATVAYNVTGDQKNGTAYYIADIVNSGAPFVGATTGALVTRKKTVYKADYIYVTVLLVSSLLLIVTGLVGMIMGLRAGGPDVFDPLMGLTYNNGHLGLPSPASTLDAATRARLLRGVEVRLGDVAGGVGPVGMVGVGRAHEVVPLAGGRLYE